MGENVSWQTAANKGPSHGCDQALSVHLTPDRDTGCSATSQERLQSSGRCLAHCRCGRVLPVFDSGSRALVIWNRSLGGLACVSLVVRHAAFADGAIPAKPHSKETRARSTEMSRRTSTRHNRSGSSHGKSAQHLDNSKKGNDRDLNTLHSSTNHFAPMAIAKAQPSSTNTASNNAGHHYSGYQDSYLSCKRLLPQHCCPKGLCCCKKAKLRAPDAAPMLILDPCGPRHTWMGWVLCEELEAALLQFGRVAAERRTRHPVRVLLASVRRRDGFGGVPPDCLLERHPVPAVLRCVRRNVRPKRVRGCDEAKGLGESAPVQQGAAKESHRLSRVAEGSTWTGVVRELGGCSLHRSHDPVAGHLAAVTETHPPVGNHRVRELEHDELDDVHAYLMKAKPAGTTAPNQTAAGSRHKYGWQ